MDAQNFVNLLYYVWYFALFLLCLAPVIWLIRWFIKKCVKDALREYEEEKQQEDRKE